MIPLKIKLTKINDETIDFQIIQQDEAIRKHESSHIFTSSNDVRFRCIMRPAIHSEWEWGAKVIFLRGSSKDSDEIPYRHTFHTFSAVSSFVSDLTLAVNEFNAYIADKESL